MAEIADVYNMTFYEFIKIEMDKIYNLRKKIKSYIIIYKNNITLSNIKTPPKRDELI